MKMKLKKGLLGTQGTDGILVRIFLYVALIGIGFVFLFPLLYMVAFGFQSLDDLLSVTVHWIPSSFYMGNFQHAIRVMNFIPTLLETLYITLVPTVLQVIMCAFIGYGFARFEFRGKRVLLILVLSTFIIPPSVLLIPRYLLFHNMGILGSIASYALPAALGQGLNSAIFILIFFQTFRALPKALEEAAQLDGAGHFKIFVKIALPLATSAIIVSLLFSFVWYWNETYLVAIYFRDAFTTLPLELDRFIQSFNEMFARVEGTNINEGIEMAGTLLAIVPLLLLFFVMQRWFVESVDRSGIAGE